MFTSARWNSDKDKEDKATLFGQEDDMFPVGDLNLHSCHKFSADINLYWEITAGNWFINVAVEEKQDELHMTLKLTVSFVVVFGKIVKKFYVFVISNVVMQPFSFSDKK